LNRAATALGLVLALVGISLFLGVFSGTFNSLLAALAAVVTLPIGSAIAFYGSVSRGPVEAERGAGGAAAPQRGGGATVWAAIAVAVLAMILAIASLSVAFSDQSAINSVSSQVSQVSSSLSGLNNTASINTPPRKIAIKVDWCNTDPTGQDRFCPNQIVVYQGDIVQLMFIHNDTDAHTFTLLTAPYLFQINASVGGMRNFLTNATIGGTCSNSGTYSQQIFNVSGIYCVSGPSLLPTSVAGNFLVAQNPTPALPGKPSGLSLVIVPVDNKVHVNVFNASSGMSEVWGIGAFQAVQPGIYEFICHYHVSNGMFGYLIVLPNAYCNSHPSSCGIKSA
jgi:plastocyanin